MSVDRPPRVRWAAKFRHAFRGAVLGFRGESSYYVHLPVALVVVVLAACLAMPLVEWCLLIGCVSIVLVAEMFNSAIERLAKAITDRFHPELRDALDMSSAAVLMAAGGAGLIGSVLFLRRLAVTFSLWPT